jgi:hypothetical protein
MGNHQNLSLQGCSKTKDLQTLSTFDLKLNFTQTKPLPSSKSNHLHQLFLVDEILLEQPFGKQTLSQATLGPWQPRVMNLSGKIH